MGPGTMPGSGFYLDKYLMANVFLIDFRYTFAVIIDIWLAVYKYININYLIY